MADDGHDEKAVAVAPPPPAELPEIKLFGRWSCDDVQISDMSLQVRVSSHVRRLQDIIPVVRLYLQQMSHSCHILFKNLLVALYYHLVYLQKVFTNNPSFLGLLGCQGKVC